MKTASHERKNIKDRSLNHDSHYRENVVRESSCCVHKYIAVPIPIIASCE